MKKINNNTKILISGVAFSSVGDWLNTLALMSWFVEKWPSLIVLLMLTRALPAIVLTPVISGSIDKLNKKKVLIFTNLLQAIIVLFIPVSLGNEHILLCFS